MIHYNNYKLPDGLEYVGDGWTVRKTATCKGNETFEFIKTLCQRLIVHPDPMIVPVYSFKYLGACADFSHKYQYDMRRLGDLSKEETETIWQVGDAWRAGSSDPTRIFVPKPVFEGYIPADKAWEKYPKLMHFLQEVIKLDRYHDLHGENVMMDEDENYRLIDVEGFLNPPLARPSNAWIRD